MSIQSYVPLHLFHSNAIDVFCTIYCHAKMAVPDGRVASLTHLHDEAEDALASFLLVFKSQNNVTMTLKKPHPLAPWVHTLWEEVEKCFKENRPGVVIVPGSGECYYIYPTSEQTLAEQRFVEPEEVYSQVLNRITDRMRRRPVKPRPRGK